ncbi:FkbM family methyltransferase [Phormidesmis sp. 146-35]
MIKNIKPKVKDLIQWPLALLRKHSLTSMPSATERLRHTQKLGFSPKVIFDGGAFKGTWSATIADIFPQAQIVLMEPNPSLQAEISSTLAHIKPAVALQNLALGAAPGESSFNIWGDADKAASASLLNHTQGQANQTVQVKVDTLDNIATRLNLFPNLVKLDLQGGELPALKGGSQVLNAAELFVIEFGCLEAYVDRTTPKDLMEIMYDHHYCLYDIVECHYRPYDGALTGGDFIFVKNDSELRRYKGWK